MIVGTRVVWSARHLKQIGLDQDRALVAAIGTVASNEGRWVRVDWDDGNTALVAPEALALPGSTEAHRDGPDRYEWRDNDGGIRVPVAHKVVPKCCRGRR